METVGEEGVYKRKRTFDATTKKKSVVDGGVPQVDSSQGEVNFQQLMKKEKSERKENIGSGEIDSILAAAKAKERDRVIA